MSKITWPPVRVGSVEYVVVARWGTSTGLCPYAEAELRRRGIVEQLVLRRPKGRRLFLVNVYEGGKMDKPTIVKGITT